MHTGLRITAFAAALAATFGTAYGVGRSGPGRRGAGARCPRRARQSNTGTEGGRRPRGGTRTPRPAGCRSPRTATPSTSPPHASPPVSAPSCASPSGTAAVRPSPRTSASTTRNSTSSWPHATWSPTATCTPRAPPTAPGAPRGPCLARAAAASSPTSPRRRRTRRTSPSAPTSPPPARYEPANLPAPDDTPPGPTATRSNSPDPCAPARRVSWKQKVSRDGEPVNDLQPYLGAYGHLVALRSGDLAYLHVHPERRTPATAPRSPARRSPSRPPRPARAPTVSSWTSSTRARSAPRRSTVRSGSTPAGAGPGSDPAHRRPGD